MKKSISWWSFPGAVDVFFNPSIEVVPYDVAYRRAFEAIKECVSIAEE
jgi:hypothetical protein